MARSAVGARHGRTAAHARAELRRRRDRTPPRPAKRSTSGSMRNGQTPRLREMLWDPLALAALNQPPEPRRRRRSRACSPKCSEPIRARQRSRCRPAAAPDVRGARARATSKRTAERCGPAPPRRSSRLDGSAVVAVQVGGDTWPAARGRRRGAVVRARRRCSTGEPPALREPIDARAAAWRRRPIVTVNLWFDRPVIDEPFIGLPGRTMQWVFDKRRGVRRRRRRICRWCRAAPSRCSADQTTS